MDASVARVVAAPPQNRAAHNPLSLVRVEKVIARSAAGVGLAFFAQSAPVLIAQVNATQPLWTAIVTVVVVGALAFALVAAVVRRLVTVAMLVFPAAYLIVVITWPFAVLHPAFDSPWFYYLMTVATAMAAIGLNVPFAAAYLLVVPALYALIRISVPGGSVPPLVAVFNSAYSVILGGAVLLMITMLRTASSRVDIAQTTALERYASVVRQHAMEAERVRVDAIVHDSVLTTFISAARAETPEAMKLSASMAAAAITHLREAALVTPEDGSTVRIALVADGIRDAVRQLPADFQIIESRLGPRAIPAAAGEAMHAAAVQAAVNSVNHAGEQVHRTLQLSDAGNVFEIRIADDGVGFDPERIPQGRLGVRTSIVERLSNAGGLAEIRSSPGGGTTITLRWPAPLDDDREVGA